jgi:hypothetical protein
VLFLAYSKVYRRRILTFVYIVTTAGVLVNVALLSDGIVTCSVVLWCVAHLRYSITLFGGLITIRGADVSCYPGREQRKASSRTLWW